jgi:2-amino-4-hydroxy-6-hydroxymethyldihydropteridine diphosphokinase
VIADGEPLVRACLGLGSNLGDRLVNLREAARLLSEGAGLRLLRSSRVYETAPVGPAQPDYLNAVLLAGTSLGPRGLLAACLDVEALMGRVRTERWGPRIIDVDLLTYDRRSIDEPGLVVPHPRMHERAFVLVPLLELDPCPMLPGGRSVGALRLDSMAVRPTAPPIVVP